MEGNRKVEEVRRPWIDFERRQVWPGFHQERQGLERFYQLDVVYGVGWQSAVQVSVPLYSRRRPLHRWRDRLCQPGVQVSLPRRGSAYAFVQHPLYRHVNDQQLTPRYSILLGLSKSF